MASGLEGANELDKQLDELKKGFKGSALRAIVRAGIAPARNKARATAPTGTEAHRTYKGRLVAPGFTKRSVRVVTKLDRSGEKASAVLGVRAEAFYSLQFIELGTSKIPKRPWLVPAFESSIAEIEQAMVEAGRKQIAKAIAKGGAL